MPSSEMVLIQGKDEPVDGQAPVRKLEFLNGAHARPKNPEVKATASLQSWWGQQIPFSTIVSSGALVKNADGTYSGSGGFTFSMSYSSKLSCLLIMHCRLGRLQ